MNDKLKDGVNPNGFHYPFQYETMSIKTAFDFLNLAKGGHGMLFEPDNIYGFLSLLVMKCGVDIDYAFSSAFEYNPVEVAKHVTKEVQDLYELKEDIKNKIENIEKNNIRTDVINAATDRYNQLGILKKIRENLLKRKPSQDFFEGKNLDEINSLYTPKNTTKKLNRIIIYLYHYILYWKKSYNSVN